MTHPYFEVNGSPAVRGSAENGIVNGLVLMHSARMSLPTYRLENLRIRIRLPTQMTVQHLGLPAEIYA
jgi:hypothetical protein